MQPEANFSVRVRAERVDQLPEVDHVREVLEYALMGSIEVFPSIEGALHASSMTEVSVAIFLDCIREACRMSGFGTRDAEQVATHAYCRLREVGYVALPAVGLRPTEDVGQTAVRPSLRLVGGTEA